MWQGSNFDSNFGLGATFGQGFAILTTVDLACVPHCRDSRLAKRQWVPKRTQSAPTVEAELAAQALTARERAQEALGSATSRRRDW